MLPVVKRAVPRAVRVRLRRILATHGRDIDKRFASAFVGDLRELVKYRTEVASSGLLDQLDAAQRWLQANVRGRTARGNEFEPGGIDFETGMRLYALIRHLKPVVVVETGVCNGFSTVFVLSALHRNRLGILHSIDFPEVAGVGGSPDDFWDGKGGAVIPPGRQPGWVVPHDLRDRWQLVLGRSQEVLPPLLARLGDIDFFLHDSEHSYECMTFEFELAYSCLRRGGVLAADDTDWNTAFHDFAARHGREVVSLGSHMLAISKSTSS